MNSKDLKLREDDIPGAKLQKPVEQCTVAVLKRWLICRGAKVAGKRQDLVKRYALFFSCCKAPSLCFKILVFVEHKFSHSLINYLVFLRKIESTTTLIMDLIKI